MAGDIINRRKYIVAGLLLLTGLICNRQVFAQQSLRKDVLINNDWVSLASDTDNLYYDTAFNLPRMPVLTRNQSEKVTVPHTWDTYGGYRQLKHGNRHGYAWYRKEISIGKEYSGKQLFLWFEGVSSFATVWVNGKLAGTHAGGRTSFSLNITGLAASGRVNFITVKAAHPAMIRTLPWVCGGCSEEQGFSEGSQPMGIFRPVHLLATSPVRIEPFGIHIWNDSNVTAEKAVIHTTTEVKNYTSRQQQVTVYTRIIDPHGKMVHAFRLQRTLYPNQTSILPYSTPALSHPDLWSLEQPDLYKAVTRVIQNGRVIDESVTDFGIRTVKWTLENADGERQLLINGKPVFLNGTAEYEHLMGNSHAFTEQEVKARVMQVKAAGFNSFRDAHQPHNLRYHPYWDSMGIAWWPQFAAHVWFDLPEFRTNFKSLLRDWVKERRNSPSIILWGLENESTLPEDFARECSAIIRELDPTASSQRKITTCNGGKGTDWDVPQNWTGTYGGNPADYGKDLTRQTLVGEYGAWRSIDWHAEGLFDQKGAFTEDRMTQLMEMKVRLADSVKLQTAGHYHWLLYSHDNPGRVQPDEGYRYIDKVGPVNYKGLFTIWGEPTDAFYMYRANYTSPATDPMVYIVSHTWPERWLTPGVKSGITVYSNCDEVELFNDPAGKISLGKRKRNGVGTHFQWDSVNIAYNVLYARGYVNGRPIAKDVVVLHHLPQAPGFRLLYKNKYNPASALTVPLAGYDYLYRVNCGGPAYTDFYYRTWAADVAFTDSTTAGSTSWGAGYNGIAINQASQRRTFDPVANTYDWPLFQTYRYGREQLKYHFPVEDGEYLVELYFSEPWYGIGGGLDCKQWRLFDVAINGKTVIRNLDIWKEAGANTAIKKMVKVKVTGGMLTIHFPDIKASQAVIAAIAIAKQGKQSKVPVIAPPQETLYTRESWLDKGQQQYLDTNTRFHYLPPLLYGDNWIKTSAARDSTSRVLLPVKTAAEVYIAMDNNVNRLPEWLKDYSLATDSIVTNANGHTLFRLYKKSFKAGDTLLLGKNGTSTYDTDPQMYTAIIHEPTAFEKAEKIMRPVITYPVQEAYLKGAVVDTAVAGFTKGGYASLRNISDRIVWTINVGVGDTYELRFRYRTPGDKQIPVWLTVRSGDGTIMRHDKIFFAPADKKWKTLYSSTGTNINAGNYTVQLAPETNEELFIDKLDVQ